MNDRASYRGGGWGGKIPEFPTYDKEMSRKTEGILPEGREDIYI